LSGSPKGHAFGFPPCLPLYIPLASSVSAPENMHDEV
jgi:hypothetical protein